MKQRYEINSYLCSKITEMEMTISLLITTYNWKEALRLTLRSAFAQTQLPLEILIGDDGSTDDTRELIEALRKESPVPLVHIWHEDRGFRLTEIRNKAIAKAKGNYIIQVDGDTILEKHFIEDHAELAEPNCYVCGSRVKIFEKDTQLILSGKDYDFSFFKQSAHSMLNSIRSRLLRKFFARRYVKGQIARLRGCNMAFWKKDLIEVNGYNEDLTSWGHEDSELAYRLFFAGKEKLFLKMGGVLFHLHHKSSPRNDESIHHAAIERIKENKLYWCPNGLDKHISEISR